MSTVTSSSARKRVQRELENVPVRKRVQRELENVQAEDGQEVIEWRLLQDLQRPLDPEFVHERDGPGGTKLSYLNGADATFLLNSLFGAPNWTCEVKKDEVSLEKDASGKWNASCFVVIKVTVTWPGGAGRKSSHEDVGVGSSGGARRLKAEAMEAAMKEAVTDGRKRTARHFGEALGNCLYNPVYLAWVKRQKRSPASRESVYEGWLGNPLTRRETSQLFSLGGRRSLGNDSPDRSAIGLSDVKDYSLVKHEYDEWVEDGDFSDDDLVKFM
jgi:DNA recombination protein Rad52